MRRVLGALLLLLAIFVQAALATTGCELVAPETTEVGEATTFTGSAFDAGSVAHLFLGDVAIGSGTVSESGSFSVSYGFSDEGHFWVQMVGVSGGDWCATQPVAITVGTGGDGPLQSPPDVEANLAAAQVLTPTTLVLSRGAFGDGFTIGSDDLESAVPPAMQQAAFEGPEDSTPSTVPDTTSATVAGGRALDDSAAAAPAGTSDGGTSIVPLAVLIGALAAVLGVVGGVVVGRRRA